MSQEEINVFLISSHLSSLFPPLFPALRLPSLCLVAALKTLSLCSGVLSCSPEALELELSLTSPFEWMTWLQMALVVISVLTRQL